MKTEINLVLRVLFLAEHFLYHLCMPTCLADRTFSSAICLLLSSWKWTKTQEKHRSWPRFSTSTSFFIGAGGEREESF